MNSENRNNNRILPIRPEEVDSAKLEKFPGEVIESFNVLLVQKAGGDEIHVFEEEVVALMEEKGLDRGEIYKNGWLNIEGLYKQFGWKVTYDKPGYNETYRPSFTFKPLKRTE